MSQIQAPVLPDTTEVTKEITLESLAIRMDALGKQMDWLCENLQSLFLFVNQMGANGGGIRGLMAAMKKGAPELTVDGVESEDKVSD